jgi:Fe-S-cluster containining protein
MPDRNPGLPPPAVAETAGKPSSPVVPVQLALDDTFQFRCHKGIACFNRCCENIDILLTPYDILRMKARLGLTAREFIDACTVDFPMDAHGMPGLKLRTKDGTTACIHLTPEGCGVYPDRPAACRYYALGLISMRRKDSATDENSYFLVREPHCLGHLEPQTQTIRDYRRDQGIDEYDEINREWRQIVLKKRSSGPTVGKPSQRSLELFFLASYDIDGFRAFVCSDGFAEVFALDPDLKSRLLSDDVELLRFGFRLLKQVLFGEHSIALRDNARARRLAKRPPRLSQERERSEWLGQLQDELYESPGS